MKLSYRGVAYKPYHTTVAVQAGEVGGHYRGVPWRIHHYQEQPRRVNSLSHEFVYRGVHYPD